MSEIGGGVVTKLLRCGDVVSGCAAEIRGETDDEILLQAAEHVRDVHGIEEIDEELQARVQAAIQTTG